MWSIPDMKCPECGALMEYRGGPSDSNIFIMVCPVPGCRYTGTYYAEVPAERKKTPMFTDLPKRECFACRSLLEGESWPDEGGVITVKCSYCPAENKAIGTADTEGDEKCQK